MFFYGRCVMLISQMLAMEYLKYVAREPQRREEIIREHEQDHSAEDESYRRQVNAVDLEIRGFYELARIEGLLKKGEYADLLQVRHIFEGLALFLLKMTDFDLDAPGCLLRDEIEEKLEHLLNRPCYQAMYTEENSYHNSLSDWPNENSLYDLWPDDVSSWRFDNAWGETYRIPQLAEVRYSI